MLAALLFAATTHVVNVNADGSFSPPVVTIASGDSVQWTFSSPADSIVSINWDGTSAGYCSAVNPYSADDFTGPMPVAPGGVFTISPVTVGFVAQPAAATCAGGQSPKATAAGQMLCRGGPTTYAATMDATWQDPTLTGVFIRLLWSDIEPSLNTYDFTIVDREVAKAVKNGKVYSLGIKAGDDGTPSWLFTNGVTPLQLPDSGSDGNEPSCGSRMTLGNPTELAYQNRYFDLLRAVAAHLRSRADWYRALAYIKPSGANLFTHENRLPKRCESNCICNAGIGATRLHAEWPLCLLSGTDRSARVGVSGQVDEPSADPGRLPAHQQFRRLREVGRHVLERTASRRNRTDTDDSRQRAGDARIVVRRGAQWPFEDDHAQLRAESQRRRLPESLGAAGRTGRPGHRFPDHE